MKQLFVKMTYTNETEGYTNHIETPTESQAKNLTELFKLCRKHIGGRIKKMYVDGPKGEPIHVGYVCERRQKYEDTGETYLEGVWIELLEQVEVQRTVKEFKPFGVAA